MEFFREIDSTNRVVKEALEHGCEQGFCAVSLKQTAGYGRQGRVWSSPEGGVYFSVALRPQAPLERIPTLALLAALSVRQGLVSLQLLKDPAAVQIKWPNDVVVAHPDGAGFAKLCGISCEHRNGGVCVGIGVNVLRAAAVETDGRYTPGYVSDMASPELSRLLNPQGSSISDGGAQELARSVVDALLQRMPLWEAEGFAPFAEEFRAVSYLQGKSIAVKNTVNTSQIEGMVCGIDDTGRLMVQTARGEIQALVAGEAHLV